MWKITDDSKTYWVYPDVICSQDGNKERLCIKNGNNIGVVQ